MNSLKLSQVDISDSSWEAELVKNIQNPDSALYKVEDIYKKTNAMAISICLHAIDTLQYFLKYTGCDEVDVWGFGQKWGAVHLATNPGEHISALKYDVNALDEMNGTLGVLKEHGANFNYKPAEGHGYRNPPLALGEPSGRLVISREVSEKIIKPALIKFGANPFLIGSSVTSSSNYPALKQVIESGDYNAKLLMLQYISSVITHKDTWISQDILKQTISTKLEEFDIFTVHEDRSLVKSCATQEILGATPLAEAVVDIVYDYLEVVI